MAMQDVIAVWDSGDRRRYAVNSRDDSLEARLAFTAETGATRIVELQWMYEGKIVSCPFPASVLPDLSGVVLTDEWHFQGQPREGPEPYPKHLRVLNPDGSLRLRIYPPRSTERFNPDDHWIDPPSDFSHRGIPFGCPACDGYRDMVIEFDWTTGEMLRWIDAANWLRR